MKAMPILLLVLSGAIAAAPAVYGQQAGAAPPPAIPHLRTPGERLLTAGQPPAEAWSALAGQGVTTVVDLRADGELVGRDEAAEVAAAGMAYRRIPVDGAAGITVENARTLRRLLQDARGKVLVHCASGNRVGALIALGEADAGMPAEQALARGRAAGMTGAEARVRELLGLPPMP